MEKDFSYYLLLWYSFISYIAPVMLQTDATQHGAPAEFLDTLLVKSKKELSPS